MSDRPLLRTEELVKEYTSGAGNRVVAVDNVEFDIWPGEFVMIVGPSGCGKTTLLALLGGLERPTSGEIYLDGVDLAELSEKEIAEVRRFRVGFIFQSFHLVPYLSAFENVMLPLSFASGSREQKRERVDELLEAVGLADRADHYPSELSGGQKQRVAIARALANSPTLILADEPTGNLDSKSGRATIELFAELNRQRSHTVLLVTHDTSLAEYADRVVRLQDGRIVGDQQE
jgi:putative ABC transport system ATP-binding protein